MKAGRLLALRGPSWFWETVNPRSRRARLLLTTQEKGPTIGAFGCAGHVQPYLHGPESVPPFGAVLISTERRRLADPR